MSIELDLVTFKLICELQSKHITASESVVGFQFLTIIKYPYFISWNF